jgi:hypothetical protein
MTRTQPDATALDGVVSQVLAASEAAGMTVIPAVPDTDRDSGWLVELGPGQLDVQAFLALAASAGARLLYLEESHLDPENDSVMADVDDQPTSPEARRLQAEIRDLSEQHQGDRSRVTVAFAAGWVLHLWRTQADWYSTLLTLAGELGLLLDEDDDSDAAGGPDEADVERLAQEVLALPQFRTAWRAAGAASLRQRHRVVHEHLDACGQWDSAHPMLLYRVTDRATDLATDDVERVYADIHRRLPELALAFTNDARYRQANNINLVRNAARQFLTEQAGGYPPTSVDRDLLLATPPLDQRVNRGRPASNAPMIDLPE